MDGHKLTPIYHKEYIWAKATWGDYSALDQPAPLGLYEYGDFEANFGIVHWTLNEFRYSNLA
jgi:hypothetical protein